MLGVQLSVISPRDLEPLRMLYRTALNENAAIENLEVMTKDGQLVMFCLPSRVLEFLAEQLAPLPHVHTTKPPVNNKPGTSTSAHPAGANNATTNTNPKSNGFTPAGRGANYNADATAIPNANAMNNGKGPVNLLSPGPGMPFQPTPSPTQANNASSLHWNGTLRWNQIEYPHMCALSARFVNGAKNTQAFPLDRLPQNLEITTVHARDQLGIEPQAELKANGFIVMHGLSTIPPEEKRVNDLRLETIKSRLSVNDCYGYVQLPANPENKDLLILALLAGGRLNLFGLVIPSLNSGQSIFRTANMVTPQQIGTQGTMGMSPTLGLARGQQTPTPAQTQAHTQAQVQAQAQMLHNRQMGSPMTSNQATQQQHQQQQQQMMYGRHMQ
ncbi:hypothetical protein SARC_08584 [Sphaeroforma arctica JP610]|uniref:Uncharacterized protein n=1 Tax=Sphaeroforma arctica JP610 TaxID=667725 RepID=A0A0L0FQE8_9EUKA|nr:hypothetical protein SARC_08584 [Sphaeroforma arctica JP610]KNC79010.1 hypothetical protein SARC_08584 [Sphaeroforma arctica JP610]|eukprot:XP_014152912.1 hypothetical protein SARC_08584 [Sphaeroforma arctica JP610]